jgi:hypothetical protein
MAAMDDLSVWITRDERELPLIAMDNQHLHSAIASLTRWRGHEKDEDKRAELKTWIARFKAELKTRNKAAERELKLRAGGKVAKAAKAGGFGKKRF